MHNSESVCNLILHMKWIAFLFFETLKTEIPLSSSVIWPQSETFVFDWCDIRCCVLMHDSVHCSSLSENNPYNHDGCPLGQDAQRLNVAWHVCCRWFFITSDCRTISDMFVHFSNLCWEKCCEKMLILSQFFFYFCSLEQFKFSVSYIVLWLAVVQE